MSWFFFDLHEFGRAIEDEEGSKHVNLEAAHTFATAALRGVVAAQALEGRISLSGRIEVSDGQHMPVLTVNFDEAVAVEVISRPDVLPVGRC